VINLKEVPTFKLESTLEQFDRFLSEVSYNVGEEFLLSAKQAILKELIRREKYKTKIN
jgi:hypothetical protein